MKKKNTFFLSKMEQVSSGFSERYLLDPTRFRAELDEYKRYIKSMLELIGAGEKSSDFSEEILDFSTQIAKVRDRNYVYTRLFTLIDDRK